MHQQRDQGKRTSNGQRFWQAHVNALSKSGLSRKEYCRQQQLSYHAMIYWQKKLQKQKKNIAPATLIPVSLLPRCGERDSKASSRASLTVTLGDRYSIRVGDDFSGTTLTRLLQTLESIS
jgi:hypothetical protein